MTFSQKSSCFAGEVELENLPLKKDALQKFDLPIEVKAGRGYDGFLSCL